MNVADDDASIMVRSADREYEVRIVSDGVEHFGEFARRSLDASWAGRSSTRAAIVTDANVSKLVGPFAQSLRGAGIESTTIVVPPGEESKSLDLASAIYDRLVELRADRHLAVVAIGGGVVGDLAGFVAATYARGLPLLMVPTTLLAQVDSSVGGKVGVNLPKAKNVVGAFHPPSGVWIDSTSLRTLPDREFRCGLAEVVKHGMILDAGFFAELEANADAILSREPRWVRRVVARSCEIKAGVVEGDEREETGLRAVLNFGHTVGHAVESVAGYGGAFHHGEAVAVGMVVEARIAERMGWTTGEVVGRLVALLGRLGLPTRAAGLPIEPLMAAMSLDKKNRGGRVRFVLPRAVGRVELTDEPMEAVVRSILAESGATR